MVVGSFRAYRTVFLISDLAELAQQRPRCRCPRLLILTDLRTDIKYRHGRSSSDCRPSAPGFHAITPPLAPDRLGAERVKPPRNLTLRAEVFVSISQRIVRIQQGPLALKIVIQGKRMIIGQHRRNPAQKRLRNSVPAGGFVERKEHVDETLRTTQPGLGRHAAKNEPNQQR